MGFRELLRKPSGFTPFVLAAAALTLVLGYAALYGVEPQPDEGTPARLFQLLISTQLVATGVVGFRAPAGRRSACFSFRSVPRSCRSPRSWPSSGRHRAARRRFPQPSS